LVEGAGYSAGRRNPLRKNNRKKKKGETQRKLRQGKPGAVGRELGRNHVRQGSGVVPVNGTEGGHIENGTGGEGGKVAEFNLPK